MSAPALPPPPADSPSLPRWLHQLWTRVAGLEMTEAGPRVLQGAGVPTVAAPSGSVYLRTDGGAGSTLYVREGGSWTAK